MSRYAVQAIDLSKRFGALAAVNNVNLQVEEGSFFSLLGPSGCGKTTLLRMIAGFDAPTAGKLLIGGADMVAVPPYLRPVNMVFQNYALFPHLTVRENIAFGLKAKRHFNRAEVAEKVNECLDLVRLSEFADRSPHQLSGGQQQRVAVARAVVMRPKVLLLDEPLSALDPQIREEMQIELADLQRRLEITFIMVTHDQNEALALSDQIAVFCQGVLEQVGSPEEIYEKPETVFVAQFIGQTNLIEAKVIGKERNRFVVRTERALNLTATAAPTRIAVGDSVTLWIKPHSLDIVAPGDKSVSSDYLFDAVIVNRSYQGTTTEYSVKVASDLALRVSRNNNLAAPESFKVGDAVKLSIPPESCSLLLNGRSQPG